MINFALIGAGRIGKLHAGNLAANSRVQFTDVADAVPVAAENLADAFGIKATSVDGVIADDRIDAVLIASSTETHADLIEEAAAAGKAIFCEKPVDLDYDRAAKAVAAAENHGVPLAIGFNRRFDHNFRSLKDRLRAGAIGAVETVSLTSRDPSPPPVEYLATSGGLFRDMMIHDLDMVRWLIDEDPVELHAYGANLVDPEIGRVGDIDTAMVTMRMASGRLAHITTSRRASYGYDQRIECHGEKGMIRAGNVPVTTVEVAGASGYQSDPAMPFFLERYDQAYKAELDQFVDDLLSKTPPSPSGADGLAALALADYATQSYEAGAAVKIDRL